MECEVKDTHKKLPIPEMMGILRMINRIKNEVFAFFDGRYTNAYAESFNNLIKRFVHFGNGYRFESLRGKVLYGTEATKVGKLKDMQNFMQLIMQWVVLLNLIVLIIIQNRKNQK